MERHWITDNLFADEFCRVWKKESFLDGVKWTLTNLRAEDFIRVSK